MRSKTLITISITILFFLLNNLNSLAISRWDEYTNIKVVEETGHSFELKYNGEPFFEKPPLWHFLTSFIASGGVENPASYRLISAISGFIIIILTFLITYKKFGKTPAILSVLTILSIQQLFLINRDYFSTHNLKTADLDALQILFIILSISPLLSIKNKQFGHPSNRIYVRIILSAVFSGLGFMTKEFFSLIPFFLLLIFLLINIKIVKLKYLLIYLFIFSFSFLLIALPWHLFMIFKYGKEFIEEYFLYHAVTRFSSSIEGHTNDIFHYLRILTNREMFPSFLLLILSTIYWIKKFSYKCVRNYDTFIILAFPVFLFVILLFNHTRLSWYLLPIYPFCAIIIGVFINDFLKGKINIKYFYYAIWLAYFFLIQSLAGEYKLISGIIIFIIFLLKIFLIKESFRIEKLLLILILGTNFFLTGYFITISN